MPAKKTTATKKTTSRSTKAKAKAKATKEETKSADSQVLTLTEKAKIDTPAVALSDRASDARETSKKKWRSGLGKYAKWRRQFRECLLEDFKKSKPEDNLKGEVSPNDKHGIGSRTGRVWG